MKKYSVVTLPAIVDEQLIQLCLAAQGARLLAKKVLDLTVENYARCPMDPPGRFLLAILMRSMEACLSAELLLSRARSRDAAVLILGIHELRLDMQYVAQDPARAEKWLHHIKQGTKPWRVGNQQAELYSNPRELDAEKTNYRSLSMVKHGNPAGRALSFPLAAIPDALVLDKSGTSDSMVGSHAFALSCNMLDISSAALTILGDEGVAAASLREKLAAHQKLSSQLIEQQIPTLIRGHQQKGQDLDGT